jgi:hypothetical protein
MSCQVLLITLSDVSDRLKISSSLELEDFRPYIILAQELYLSKILCKDFYDEIIQEYQDDSFSTENQTLYDEYIKKALVYRAYACYLAEANIHVKNSGLRTFIEDDSADKDSKSIYSMVRAYEQRADSYENFLKEYLEDNASTFPTYYANCNSCKTENSALKITSIGYDKYKKRCDKCYSVRCRCF